MWWWYGKGGGAQWMKIFVTVRIWDDLCGGGMEKGGGGTMDEKSLHTPAAARQ